MGAGERKLLRGFLVQEEEPVYRLLWIGDNQPLFLWPWFTLLALSLRFLNHNVIVSPRFLSGTLVPQPGIGPGRPDWSHGCKPCASTNSATGAHCVAPNVGAVGSHKNSAAPTLFGPIGAALNFSSRCFSSRNSCDGRSHFFSDYQSFGNPGIAQAVAPTAINSDSDNAAFVGELVYHPVNAWHCKAGLPQSLHHFPTRDRLIPTRFLLTKKNQERGILDGFRPCGQRYVATFNAQNLSSGACGMAGSEIPGAIATDAATVSCSLDGG
jgi:hypothetical protein